MKWHPVTCKRCKLLTGWALRAVDPYYCIGCFDHVDLKTGNLKPPGSGPALVGRRVGKEPALAAPYGKQSKLSKSEENALIRQLMQ
jgi:hypothetical protein